MIHVRLTALVALICLITETFSFRLTPRQGEIAETSSNAPAAFVPPGSMSRAPTGVRSISSNAVRPPNLVPQVPTKAAGARSHWQNHHLAMNAHKPTEYFTKATQLPPEDWPAGVKSYRFVKNDDPTPKGCTKMPTKYQGTRTSGAYTGSSRVKFDLPRESVVQGETREGCDCKTMELLRSNSLDNPSFGVVEVKLPFDVAVTKSDTTGRLAYLPTEVTVAELKSRQRLVVTNVKEGNAEFAGLRRGDIIRAVSAPAREMTEKPWWGKVFQTEAPAAEEGLVMLDGVGKLAYEAVLKEKLRQGQETAILVIERPFSYPVAEDTEHKSGGGGIPAFPFFPQQQPQPVLVPIPIPVEPDPRPGDMGYPGPGGNGGGYGGY